MKVLGIDPGFGRCGYAVLEKKGSSIDLLSFGTITTKPKMDFCDRLEEIGDDIEYLLKKFTPDALSIEDLFFVNNVTTGIKVAQVRGMILFLAKQHKCRIYEPKPVEIKSHFTGNGKATKADMKQMVQVTFGLEKTPKIDDAADAIGAAYWAFYQKTLG